jgi:hypothetical protein
MAELMPDLDAFMEKLRAILDKPPPRFPEDRTALLRFEENGRECGIETRLESSPPEGAAYSGRIAMVNQCYLPWVALVLAKYPGLVSSADPDLLFTPFLGLLLPEFLAHFAIESVDVDPVEAGLDSARCCECARLGIHNAEGLI